MAFSHTEPVFQSRSDIKAELAGNLVFDQESVLSRLGTLKVPETVVKGCLDALKCEDVRRHMQQLNSIVKDAEDDTDWEFNSESYKNAMNPSLDTILNIITGQNGSDYRRAFRPADSDDFTSEVHAMDLPIYPPDFSLLDPETSEAPSIDISQPPRYLPRWRYRQAFVQVQPSSKQGPNASHGDTVVEIVQRAADNARLHMAARPFQLFTIGLLIFGMRFCVAIHDRGGVTFSPEEDLNNDNGLELFVRVVRRMACDMTPVELGQDPTAQQLAPDHPAAARLREDALSHHLNAPAGLPTYSVSLGGLDKRRWGTVSVVWSSIELLGRGTTVQIVRELVNGVPTGDFKIMKTSWRRSDRIPESDVYKAFGDGHPAVAKFDTGTDVYFPGSSEQKIRISSLRGASFADDDPILHRLILSSVGRPIWEYSSEEELLRGLKAAVLGHKYLVEKGVMHSDISAGNVLLSSNPVPGGEGFLTDFDFAHVSKEYPLLVGGHPVAEYQDKQHIFMEPHTAHITGTLQFMSIRALHSISLTRQGLGAHKDVDLNHYARDDVESFLWVLCYALMRHAITHGTFENPKVEAGARARFSRVFGCLSVEDVLCLRVNLAPMDLHIFDCGISPRMLDWVERLQVDLTRTKGYRPRTGFDLTHDELVGKLDEGIVYLANQ